MLNGGLMCRALCQMKCETPLQPPPESVGANAIAHPSDVQRGQVVNLGEATAPAALQRASLHVWMSVSRLLPLWCVA
jgi:hypothetical protein